MRCPHHGLLHHKHETLKPNGFAGVGMVLQVEAVPTVPSSVPSVQVMYNDGTAWVGTTTKAMGVVPHTWAGFELGGVCEFESKVESKGGRHLGGGHPFSPFTSPFSPRALPSLALAQLPIHQELGHPLPPLR